MNFDFLLKDISLISIIIIVLIILSFKFGKKPIVSLILSVYPTILLFQNIPFTFLNLEESSSKLITLIILYGLIVFSLSKNISVKRVHTKFRKFVDYSLLNISFIFLLMSIYVNKIIFLDQNYNISKNLVELIDKIPFWLALTLPIIILFFTNKSDIE